MPKIEILSIKVVRSAQALLYDDNGVNGTMKVYYTSDGQIRRRHFNTLENIENIFPAKGYKCVFEWSPKFKRNLLEVKGVKGREEIKFHQGSKSEHSEGCILMSSSELSEMMKLLQSDEEKKEFFIEFINF